MNIVIKKFIRLKREADWSAIRPGCNERRFDAKKSLVIETLQIINIFSRRSDAHCNRGRLRSSPLRVFLDGIYFNDIAPIRSRIKIFYEI